MSVGSPLRYPHKITLRLREGQTEDIKTELRLDTVLVEHRRQQVYVSRNGQAISRELIRPCRAILLSSGSRSSDRVAYSNRCQQFRSLKEIKTKLRSAELAVRDCGWIMNDMQHPYNRRSTNPGELSSRKCCTDSQLTVSKKKKKKTWQELRVKLTHRKQSGDH